MAKRIMETYQWKSCHPFQETNNYGNGRVPRSTLTWKKNVWKFNCSTSRPFQKGSVYKVLPIFEVCIFISKTELWKNTAPARRSCLLAHVEPFSISKILSVTIIKLLYVRQLRLTFSLRLACFVICSLTMCLFESL